jgi:ribosome-associated toxin RatA of RatAB toxin-antitoxin module
MATIRGQRSAELPCPASEAYAVLADVARYPDWQSDVKSATVLDEDAEGRPVRAEITQDAKVRTVTVRVRYSHDAPREMAWELESGDVKALDGSWRLEELSDGRTRATYTLAVDPGRALGLLLRGPVVQRVTDHVLDGTLAALRARVET